MIKYAAQKICKEDINEVVKSLKKNLITQGELVNIFEKNISRSVNSKYCNVVNSASSALLLSCLALGLDKSYIGWTTPNTFAATANAILLTGGKLDFVDIDKDSFNLCPKKLEEKLKKTKKKFLPNVLIVVHFGGCPCNMERIYQLSKKYNFKIIEDASHSIGSKYKNKFIGSCKYSSITVFSFHAIKTITTGEGGAITTNNREIYNKIKLFRTNGISRENLKNKDKWYYEQKTIGFNFRMNEIQAALGLSQLKKLNKWTKKRNLIAKFYKKNLSNLPITFQKINSDCYSSYHLFIILLKKKYSRNKLYKFLKKRNIETNVVYIPLYRMPFHKDSYQFLKFKGCEQYYKSCLSIPLHLNLTKKDLMYITSSIKNFFI